MRKASVGFVAVLAAALLGFLSFGVLDRYIYEHGFNLNLKLVVLVVLGLVIVGAALAMLTGRPRRRGPD